MKWLKVFGVAIGGAALKVGVEAIPVLQNTKYGPAIAVGVAVASAYASRSPFLQQIVASAEKADQ
jgi:hypothetical protein